MLALALIIAWRAKGKQASYKIAAGVSEQGIQIRT